MAAAGLPPLATYVRSESITPGSITASFAASVRSSSRSFEDGSPGAKLTDAPPPGAPTPGAPSPPAPVSILERARYTDDLRTRG